MKKITLWLTPLLLFFGCMQRASQTRALLCPTSATCPTRPPTCVNNSKQTVFCNLAASCFQACSALMENLWVSGCISFQDCGEITRTASQFLKRCNTDLINFDPDEFDIVALYDVFVDGIYDATPCRSNLVGAKVEQEDISSETDFLSLPSVQFCMPVDYTNLAQDNKKITLDICFVVPADGSAPDGDVAFVGLIVNQTSGAVSFAPLSAVPDVTTAGGGTFNYYKASLKCASSEILDNFLVLQGDISSIGFPPVQSGDFLSMLFFRSISSIFGSDVDTFTLPVYVTSITTRYPRVVCPLPVSSVNCPVAP